jgi:hypothetical protein
LQPHTLAFTIVSQEHHHHHHLWHDIPLWHITSLGFPDNRIFTRWSCQPHAQPPTRRTRPPYLCPPETGNPAITPGTYDKQELRWEYSYPPVTTRRFSRRYLLRIQDKTPVCGMLCVIFQYKTHRCSEMWGLNWRTYL